MRDTFYKVTITKVEKPGQYISRDEVEDYHSHHPSTRDVYSQEFTEYELKPKELIAYLNKMQPIPQGE